MSNLSIITVDSISEAEDLLAIARGSFRRYYPNFDMWYRTKILPNLGSTRWILKATSQGKKAGLCIVKDDGIEKKICSLRVDIRHRGQGVGTALIESAIDLLGDEKPLITVPQEVMPSLSPLLSKFGFEKTAEYQGLYRDGVSEYFFNNEPDSHNHFAGVLINRGKGVKALAAV